MGATASLFETRKYRKLTAQIIANIEIGGGGGGGLGRMWGSSDLALGPGSGSDLTCDISSVNSLESPLMTPDKHQCVLSGWRRISTKSFYQDSSEPGLARPRLPRLGLAKLCPGLTWLTPASSGLGHSPGPRPWGHGPRPWPGPHPGLLWPGPRPRATTPGPWPHAIAWAVPGLRPSPAPFCLVRLGPLSTEPYFYHSGKSYDNQKHIENRSAMQDVLFLP